LTARVEEKNYKKYKKYVKGDLKKTGSITIYGQ